MHHRVYASELARLHFRVCRQNVKAFQCLRIKTSWRVVAQKEAQNRAGAPSFLPNGGFFSKRYGSKPKGKRRRCWVG